MDAIVSPIGEGQGNPHPIHYPFVPLHCQQHPLRLFLEQRYRTITNQPLIDQIMFVRAVLPLMRSHILTPLSIFQTRQSLTNFTTSKQQSIVSSMQPKLSEGQDESRVMAEAKALLENGWMLDEEEVGVKKTYHFKTYTKALVFGVSCAFRAQADTLQDFLYTIGVRSKSKNHHSVMTIVSFTLFPQCLELGLSSLQQKGSVDVHWTTHHPRGLSQKDTFMAKYCDEQAGLIGTVNTTEAQKCGPSLSSDMK